MIVASLSVGPEVVAAVASRTGLPADQLEALPLDQLLKAAPEALGEAVLRRCTREGTRGDLIRSELARAESAFAGGDRGGAQDHLDLAVAQLGCLVELPDARVAARVFLLRAALVADADAEVARGELRTALAFEPDLAWDDRYPESGRALLDEVRAAGTAATLSIVPDTATSGPWIDGREAPDEGVKVGQGLHLAQYSGPTGVASGWLLVGGDCALVLPGAYRRPILGPIADAATRGPVEALLEATIPEIEAAYVAWSGGLWLVSDDGSGLSTIEIAPPEAAGGDATDDGKKKKKKDR